MTSLYPALSAIGALVALAAAGGGLWAFFRSAAQDARIKRLQDERDDYLSRLNYIEPRHRAIEQQNELLMAMYDPSERLARLGEGHAELAANDQEILQRLSAMGTLMQQIDTSLSRPRGRRDPRETASDGDDG